MQLRDVELRAVEETLARARVLLLAEDFACLEGLARTTAELQRRLAAKDATIKGLRRFLAGFQSEKTEQVTSGGAAPGTVGAAGNDASPADASSIEASTTATESEARLADEPVSGAGQNEDGATAGPATTAEQDQAEEKVTKPRRKGHGRLGACDYPNADVTAVPQVERRHGECCPGCKKGKLRTLAQPSSILRIVGQAPLAAKRWDCENLRCNACGHVYTARAPAEAQGPKMTDSAAATCAILRYGAGMPSNRLDWVQRSAGVPVPATTQWHAALDHVEDLKPVHAELRRRAAQAFLFHTDDTTARILGLMGKRREALVAAKGLDDPKRTGLYTTGILAVTEAGLITLFCTGRQHAGENFGALLAGRDASCAPPIHMCDGLSHNSPGDHDVIEASCLAHGRRQFVDEVANFPSECRHLLVELGRVYRNEQVTRQRALTPDERLRYHQEHSKPLLDALELWMKALTADKKVEPNSTMGKAIRYCEKRWDKLTLFLRVPGAPLDNNACERILKMCIRHRRNSLFYKTQRGADVGDLYMSLIFTAMLDGQNPHHYLVALMGNPRAVREDPAAWLPWNYLAAIAAIAAIDEPRVPLARAA